MPKITAPKVEPKLEDVSEMENTTTISKMETIQKTSQESFFDIDTLAYAVAMAETKNCTLGYGKQYNNCFGIKNGNTAPCKKIGNNRMCIYDTPQESYEAFEIIWKRWYGGFPTKSMAQKWTGNDRPENWLRIVRFYFYQ